jgi:hypothetical protein
MKQITKEEALAIYDSEVWKEWDNEFIARFQLFQKKLCVPFSLFHEALEKVLDRPVFTHELGINYNGICEELLKIRPKPTMEEIIEMIPAEKLILVNIGGD